MAGLDVDKNRDTILYAKFITNVKDKWSFLTKNSILNAFKVIFK